MNTNPPEDTFEDPIENYELKDYSDPLEKAIVEGSVMSTLR